MAHQLGNAIMEVKEGVPPGDVLMRGNRAAGIVMAVLALTGSAPAFEAPYCEVNLTRDGSSHPPGDRLGVTLTVPPGEGDLTLEVRAYLAAPRPDEPAVRVRAKGRENRDADGFFLLTRSVAVPAPNQPFEVVLIVPYADLDVPAGAHRLAYEVRGTRGTLAGFVQPTEYTPLLVLSRPRTSMLVEDQTITVRKEAEVTEVQDGRVVTRKIEQEETQSVRHLVEVAIPGAFLRHDEPPPPGTPAVFGATCVGTPDGQGVLVQQVAPGSPAQKAGLEPNDVILTINGRKLHTDADFVDAVNLSGDLMAFQVKNWRDGRIVAATAPLNRPKPPIGGGTRAATDQPAPGSAAEYLAFMKTRPNVPASEVEPSHNRVVYFATNRNRLNHTGASPSERFGNELGPGVSYGSCLVNIPLEVHQPGEIEVPGLLNFWNPRDPSRYFLIEAISELDPAELLRVIHNPRGGQSNDLVVFIHGYNSTFDGLILRVAQLAHDTGFAGRAMLFSWPSQGNPAYYGKDETMAAGSGAALAKVLDTILKDRAENKVPGKLHLIAHSMGNRVLLAALNQLKAPTGASKPFGHIVMAAPDVDLLDFAQLSGPLNDLGETVTLYSCVNDVALKASRAVHTARRLGEQPYFARGLALENVRADNADTSFLGHGYIVSGTKVLKDLNLLIRMDLPADRRPTLIGQAVPTGFRFWLFR